MAIKRLTVNAVANSTLRSLNDVEDVLKTIEDQVDGDDALLRVYERQFSRLEQTKAVTVFEIDRSGGPRGKKASPKFSTDKIDKIAIPNMSTLKKNFAVLRDLETQVQMLTSLWNNVQVNFKSIRGAGPIAQKIQSLKSATEKKYARALTFLSKIGDKYEPDALKDMVEATMKGLQDNLTFRDFENYVYVFEDEDGQMRFLHYVNLIGLQNDEGDVYPHFILLFTCVLQATTGGQLLPAYYVNVMHDFEGPGTVSLGKAVPNAKQAELQLGIMLELENVSTALGTVPHNLGADDLKPGRFSAADLIQKVDADHGTVTVYFKRGLSGAQVEEAVKQTHLDLKAKIAQKRINLTMRVTREGGQYIALYTVVSIPKDGQVSTQDLQFFEDLGLDKDKIRKITRILNEG